MLKKIGQVSSQNQDKPNQSGEGPSISINERDHREPYPQIGPIDGMAEGGQLPLPDDDMYNEGLPDEY